MNECSTNVTSAPETGSRYERAMSMRTGSGGWSRADLAKLGIAWPPRKGWLEVLRREHESAEARR